MLELLICFLLLSDFLGASVECSSFLPTVVRWRWLNVMVGKLSGCGVVRDSITSRIKFDFECWLSVRKLDCNRSFLWSARLAYVNVSRKFVTCKLISIGEVRRLALGPKVLIMLERAGLTSKLSDWRGATWKLRRHDALTPRERTRAVSVAALCNKYATYLDFDDSILMLSSLGTL